MKFLENDEHSTVEPLTAAPRPWHNAWHPVTKTHRVCGCRRRMDHYEQDSEGDN